MEKIGLIAGNGRFPVLVADEIRKSLNQVITAALREEADRSMEEHSDRISWVSVGHLQKIIDFFHSEGVSTAIMAGQVKHAKLFSALKLDLRAVKLLASLANKKTDSILGAVARELEKEGIKLLPSHLYLKHLLPKPGLIAGPGLSKDEKKDVMFGFDIAKKIAGMDIGQSVAVKNRAVLAVESMEGTDECIKRAASIGGDNIIAVKVAKPSQDWRFDLPVVGTKTIEVLAGCNARAIAVEAGMTLMIDKDELIDSAKKSRITVFAVEKKDE